VPTRRADGVTAATPHLKMTVAKLRGGDKRYTAMQYQKNNKKSST
jgi:hypothetical protein